jgi:hypothetical protein
MTSRGQPGKMTRMRIRSSIAVTAVLVVAAAAVAAAVADALGATPGPPSGPYVASVPYAGQHRGAVAVLTGAASVTVSAAAIPGQLVRAWTPSGSALRPQLAVSGGTVQVFLDGTGRGGPAAVSIELSSSVRWWLRFSGGSSQTIIDMGNGHVGGVDFTAGSSVIAMNLSRPAGTVVLTLAGGASQVTIGVPAGVPARFQLWGGASAATLGGQTYTGLGGGTVLAMPGWARAPDRYDIAAPAGISDISLAS